MCNDRLACSGPISGGCCLFGKYHLFSDVCSVFLVVVLGTKSSCFFFIGVGVDDSYKREILIN